MIVVTGGAGFIGSAFIAKLNLEGIKDIVVVDEEGSVARKHNLEGKSFLHFTDKGAFLEQVLTRKLPKSLSAIIHMGACSSTTETNVEYLRKNNFEYTKSLAEYCLSSGIRFIYASSAATYGDGGQGYADDVSKLGILRPLNQYGISKHTFDVWARDHGHLDKIAGLKFFNVYGPNEYYKGDMASVAWKSFNAIQATGQFSLFRSHRPDFKDGEQKRDFVYVKDCCEIMWWLLNQPTVNGLFNVGSGTARSWNDLLAAVFSAMKNPWNVNYVDMPTQLRNQYQYFTEAPMGKLRAAGYNGRIHSLEEGVTDYVSNYLLPPLKHW
jgi:ADP-L-glycero-D-manno-heptose 6-epimerase